MAKGVLANVGHFIRMLIQPGIALILVSASVYLAVIGNLAAVKELGPFTSMALTFWFVGSPKNGNGDKEVK